jgi:hypothetical protein
MGPPFEQAPMGFKEAEGIDMQPFVRVRSKLSP